VTQLIDVATPAGLARAHVHPAAPQRRPGGRQTTLVLGHGAGGGVDARDLAALAVDLPARGVTVLLVEQPWRVAGGRVGAAAPRLDQAWIAVLADPAVRSLLRGTLVVGGRSAGARVACRTAAAVGAGAVVCLAFPLHPPGRPDRSRAAELLGAGARTLVVQGARDPFGAPQELPSGPTVVAVPCADHGFAVPARAAVTQGEALGLVVAAVARFVAAGQPDRGTG
jgi:predicted alpha/beta-hydrolase family hydrolase